MALNPVDYLSGYDGHVMVGTVELDVTKWSFTSKSNPRDLSNIRLGRFRKGGLPDASGTFDAHWDAANPPVGTAGALTSAMPNLRQGQILSPVFQVGATGLGGSWSGAIIVEEFGVEADVNGDLDYHVSWSLQSGAWTFTPPTAYVTTGEEASLP